MQKLLNIYNKDKRLAIGLMSGTSLDGIDAALVEIKGKGFDTQVDLIKFNNHPLDKKLKSKVMRACSIEESSVDLICQLNFDLGEEFAKAALDTCKVAGVAPSEVDLIGSHGQTIYHLPQKSTLQIAEPSVIAERTGILTVGDFRVRDVATGGHGAPLVPYTEYILYSNQDKTLALQNIGGIGNVTIIPKGANLDDVYAFDTGPGNMIIDAIVSLITKGELGYDKDGKLGGKGKVIPHLLDELMSTPYIQAKPPKTTGREDFGLQFSKKLFTRCRELGIKDEDMVATVTAFTARSIAYNYKRWVMPKNNLDGVIIAGGGSYNPTLINMIRKELDGVTVRLQEDLGYSSDAKEAIAFAILANETINGNSNNVPSVTEADKPVIMGKISY
ncbi:anhydro-N-acetylmuramic acid kinase AnmK [Halonatronum saccharophilum]|uniref:anhydro-N-acetylmuramic acid kinase AnmK n=1 Tax=Halonatronum saccharophilum TaxID=150060 RepID=UPI00048086B9|nr:anhydro-N-acetylmuramic acid kinase AnmK [Halonatronum saccharophilum]